MKILIDKYIPYIQGILEPYMDVEYLEPQQFVKSKVIDADALLIRTRTCCNRQLLQDTKVRFIATATIGYDHIDTDYCQRHNISWYNAAGCNSAAVCQYIEAAIEEAQSQHKIHGNTIGIIGVGHVGTLVARMAKEKGYHVLLNDPPRQLTDSEQLSQEGEVCSMKEIAQKADIITFHTPLNSAGEYPTFHLCDSQFLNACKPQVVLINAARGGIIDESAALLRINSQKTFIIDTWTCEPHINHDMLNAAFLATYHIAGYSRRGKINATNMCLEALCKFFSLPVLEVDESLLPPLSAPDKNWIRQVDEQFRQNPEKFESLRTNYPLR